MFYFRFAEYIKPNTKRYDEKILLIYYNVTSVLSEGEMYVYLTHFCWRFD